MISVTDLRAGSAFIEDGNLMKVLKYEHVKMGRGTATIKVKVKNMRSGSTTEKSFISGARVQEASLNKKELQYLYKEKSDYVFMDPISYEQYTLKSEIPGDDVNYLQEGGNVQILFYDDEPLAIEVPIKMDFKVTETDPGVKGNSATNIYKDAVLANGMHVKVPLFVQEGDLIRIDTRTGDYAERVK